MSLSIDLQGNGRPDVLACHANYPLYSNPTAKVPCRVLRPQPDGSVVDITRQLLGPGALPSVTHPREIVPGDFNRDGRLDIFIAAHGWDAPPFPGETNVLLISNADGTYTDRSSTLPQTPDFSHSACSGDINGDGNLDIYVGNLGGGARGPYFLIGRGDGTFARTQAGLPAQMLNGNETFLSCTLANIDGDGFLDLTLGTWSVNGHFDSIVLFGNGNADFTSRPRSVLPRAIQGIVLDIAPLDINGDGRADLIMMTQANISGGGFGLQVLINQGNGFADETAARVPASTTRDTGPSYSFIRFVDFNGDGWEDLYGDANSGDASYPRVWLNNGNGTWTPVAPAAMPSQSTIAILHAVDFEGDGRPDLLRLSGSGPEIFYFSFLNRTPRHSGDTDGDGLPNDWESRFGFDPSSKAGENGASGDPDGDGVTNLAELTAGTDPRIPNVQHLSEGATGFFLERLAVANPGVDPAEFKIDFLTEGSLTADGPAVITRTFTLAAQARTTIRVDTIPGLSATAVSAVLTSTKGGVVAERLMLWNAQDGSFYGGHLGKAIPSARTAWFLAEGDANFFETYILFANAGPLAANVTATYLLDTGNTIARTYVVPATARLTVFANDVPELKGRAFSTTIASTQPITVERAQYFGSTPSRLWNGGHEAAAIAAPATSWFVAEGRTGPFFSMYLLLANPNAAAAAVTIRYLKPGGAVVTRNHVLAPTSRTTIEVDGIAELEDTDVSAAVTADRPIGVERAMYWPDPFTSWYEAHDSAGVTQTGTHWALAEGEVGGALGFETYILLANPSASSATVALTFLRTSGSPITITRTVAANARLTVSAAEAGLGAGEQFGVLIVSTNGVPIVAEHAIYWNGGGQFWGGGGNETGIRLR